MVEDRRDALVEPMRPCFGTCELPSNPRLYERLLLPIDILRVDVTAIPCPKTTEIKRQRDRKIHQRRVGYLIPPVTFSPFGYARVCQHLALQSLVLRLKKSEPLNEVFGELQHITILVYTVKEID